MINEKKYSQAVGVQHIKSLGQYFTNYKIAEFMSSWACKNASTLLDPAVGNSVFLIHSKRTNPKCNLFGYEIDEKILTYFGNPSNANIINGDYLLEDWDRKFDAIVCNPPYNRFQAVSNRNEILETISNHTGIRYSGYTNLYILFLIKSIHQLSDGGRLAYIIPSEFLNSKYGIAIKQLLLEKRLLKAIINFENDSNLFFNATTTCCIMLLDFEPKSKVFFYNLPSVDALRLNIFDNPDDYALGVNYEELHAEDKWRPYLRQEEKISYTNLRPVSDFCSVSRGIATGANDFFCFSISKSQKHKIPAHCLKQCICHSADVKSPIFTIDDFKKLSSSNKTVYLLDATSNDYDILAHYIKHGEEEGVNLKYLPSCRTPWFSMEQRASAPIWVSSACRNGMKFIRNVAMVKSLTTFHSIYISEDYIDETDLIFCYFLTPTAQQIIRNNRKELGNGLEKFQPNDLNSAKMLDISMITTCDRAAVLDIYNKLVTKYDASLIEELDIIFSSYLQR